MLIVLSDDKNVTMNVHLVNHLADCVHNWGPLWSYTCFVFESMNDHLKKLYQGYDETGKTLLVSFNWSNSGVVWGKTVLQRQVDAVLDMLGGGKCQ